jgi:hypothetical protein
MSCRARRKMTCRSETRKRCSYQRNRRLRRPWWRSFQGRGALEPREFFTGVPAAESKIQVKSPSSIWRARKYAIVLEKCARLRGKEWRRGRSRGRRCSPETGGAFWQYWRRGDLWLGQPGGVLARVLERGECRQRGGLYGGVAWQRG